MLVPPSRARYASAAVCTQVSLTTLVLFTAVACQSVDVIKAGKLVLTPGVEEAPWDGPPATTSVRPFTVKLDGTREEAPRVDAPILELIVNHQDPRAYGFDATDAEGIRTVGGRSLVLQPSALAGTSIPLFFSQTRHFAEPEGEFVHPPGDNPVHAILQGRYWVTIATLDSGKLSLEGFDQLMWKAEPLIDELSCPNARCVPTAMACSGWNLLILGEDWGIWVDLESEESGDVPLPAGLNSFKELAGARTVNTSGDIAFIVGPTASRAPTDVILSLNPNRSLSVARTRFARRAAAALWVDGRGLLIVGGEQLAPAIELLRADENLAEALPYGPYPVFGAQVAVREDTLVGIGGQDANGEVSTAVAFDLNCTGACEATETALSVDLSYGVATASPPDSYVAVGRTATGAAEATVVDFRTERSQPIPLAPERLGGAFATLPTGHLGVFGGAEAAVPAKSLRLILP